MFRMKRLSASFAVGRHFALWGPPLGGVLFATLIAAGESSDSASMAILYLFAIVIAYVLGGVPAFCTGFILSFVRLSSAKQGALVAGLTGLLTSVVFIVAIEDTSAAMLGLPGAFADAAVGYFYFRKKSNRGKLQLQQAKHKISQDKLIVVGSFYDDVIDSTQPQTLISAHHT